MRCAPALLPLAITVAASACSSSGGGESARSDAAFRRCSICHRAEAGAPNGLGPNLHGVFGRKSASAANFNYSPAMRASGLTWDEATLDRFLAAPQKVVPGTRMTFSGLPDAAQRREVIQFLRDQASRNR
jgi:cytochrome c